MSKPFSSRPTYDVALQKLRRYCAYQERCHQEVRRKLLDLGVYGADLEDIIATLIEENYLDELRFAELYVRSKFNQKGWGSTRLKRELRQRNISDYCIRKALEQIEAEQYEQRLKELLDKRVRSMRKEDIYSWRRKLAQYALRRGYESELVWQWVKKYSPDRDAK